MSQYRRLPRLTRDEERALGLRIRAGDEGAVGELVEHNVALVFEWVGRLWCPPGLDHDDLFQNGLMGLLEAARKYDPERHPGSGFATYAMTWVRERVMSARRAHGREIRVPDNVFVDAAKVDRGEEVGESRKKLVAAYRRAATEMVDVGDADPPDPAAARPDERAEISEDLAGLRRAMDRLHERHRKVIEGRYYRDETLEAIGGELGITKERVRQIEVAAMRNLRGQLATMFGVTPSERGWIDVEQGEVGRAVGRRAGRPPKGEGDPPAGAAIRGHPAVARPR